MMHREILTFIGLIRESHSEMVNIYTKGSCINFYFILRGLFPGARAYYNSDHVITRIEDKYYDITGEVQPDRHSPLIGVFGKKGLSRAVRQMMRAEYKINHDDRNTTIEQKNTTGLHAH